MITPPQAPAPKAGDSVSFRKTFTVAEQAMFTGISGNLGGLYVDRSKAHAIGLGDMAVFELAAAALLSTCLTRLAGPGYRMAGFRVDFERTIVIGTTVEATATLASVDGDRLVCGLSLAADGARFASGEAVLAPAAGES
jgi:hypothetical protein